MVDLTVQVKLRPFIFAAWCEIKSAYEPSGPLGSSLSRFPWEKATTNISTSSGWDASPLLGYPSIKFAGTINKSGWREAL